MRIAGGLVEAGGEPPLRALRAQVALAEAEIELKAAQADALTARFEVDALWSQDAPPQVTATSGRCRGCGEAQSLVNQIGSGA